MVGASERGRHGGMGRLRETEPVLAAVFDGRQSTVEGLVEGDQRTHHCPISVSLFETIQSKVIVRQVELVSEEFRSRGQPRSVP